jgi:phosphopantothenoylcysteine decarboxylase/phosphopantothenate--cysteine ligase
LTSVRPYFGARIVLGVTGGIASYKAAWLARLLSKAGAAVDVVMTPAALEFVGAVTFEALTGRPVHTGLFDSGRALDHIKLVRDATAVVVAPATADFIARAASGQANDLLSASLLAAGCPVLFVPAMNDHMWAHPQTVRNVAHIRDLGYQVLDPDEGELAAGEGSGPGRMPEPESIFAHVGRLCEPAGSLKGRRVLVTAGPTREAVDPVRFISNHSSGKMGVAIAAAAWRRGAVVDLVAGPMSVAVPVGVTLHHVDSTADMAGAVQRLLPDADVLVMAAAPADFRPAEVAANKIKKTNAPPTLVLAPTPDILLSTKGARRDGMVVVGFALETEDALASGRKKLLAKDLDMIVVNDATEAGAGFGVDTNHVTFLERDREDQRLPLLPKPAVADAILDRVETLLGRR